MNPTRVIITLHHGTVAHVHASEWIEVSIINEDAPTNGDAAYVAGLKHERETMSHVYPVEKKHRSRIRQSKPPKKRRPSHGDGTDGH